MLFRKHFYLTHRKGTQRRVEAFIFRNVRPLPSAGWAHSGRFWLQACSDQLCKWVSRHFGSSSSSLHFAHVASCSCATKASRMCVQPQSNSMTVWACDILWYLVISCDQVISSMISCIKFCQVLSRCDAGGGWLSGMWGAQEECLMRRSSLYLSLWPLRRPGDELWRRSPPNRGRPWDHGGSMWVDVSRGFVVRYV